MTHRTAAAIGIAQLLVLSQAALGQTWYESCDSISAMTAAGWVFINHSSPVGITGWYQGDPEALPIPIGLGYIASDFTCGSGIATQSNWALTPVRTVYNGDSLEFSTRTLWNPATYPDRLQVRLSVAGPSTNIGSSATDVGDFTVLLRDVNPSYLSTVYPSDWRYYSTSSISGLPVTGAQCRFAFRYFVEGGGPDGTRGTMIGIDEVRHYSQGPQGACCYADGSCDMRVQSACSNAGGVFQGGNVTCGAANCPVPAFVESTDAGDLPSRAIVIRGAAGTLLPSIGGRFDVTFGDKVDIYRITICDRASFSASSLISRLYLFNMDGLGVVRSTFVSGTQIITSNLVPANGDYYLACSYSSFYPTDASSQAIWFDPASSVPSGNAAGNPVRNWAGCCVGDKRYLVNLSGACYVSGDCAANCDQSTTPPILNVNDFMCFLNAFAAGDPRTNCDHSTFPPILNANDFLCFLNEFANCS